MKRIYRFVAVFLSLFLALSVNVFAYDPVNSGINYTHTANGIVYTNTANINLDAVNGALNLVPEGIRNLCNKEGVKIYYTAGISRAERNYYGVTITPTVTYYNGSYKIASIDQRVRIYVYDDAPFNTTIPHEFGHALDTISGYNTGKYIGEYGISSSAEWQRLMAANKSALMSIDSHAAYTVPIDNDEPFAEAFRLYCTNPNGLKNACPDVYNFIAAQVAKYSPASKALTKNNFDYKAYADTYPDLKAAFGYDKDALWNHYNNFGKKEGRTANAVQ